MIFLSKALPGRGSAARRWAVLLAMASWSSAAMTADSSAIQDPQVRACIDRSTPEHTMTQKLRVQVFDATAAMRESSGTLYWKRAEDGLSKVFFRVDKSAQYQGVALLMEETKPGAEPRINMYSPELRRERRINSAALAGPLLGTDFSYEDFAQLQHIGTAGDITRLADDELEGRANYVLENSPDPELSSYSKIETYLDQQWCLPVLTRFYAQNGKLLKEMVVDRSTVTQQGERWLPGSITMTNHKQGSHTVLVVEESKADVPIPDGQFSVAKLRQGS